MKRAIRRHHKRRMKAKAVRIYGKWKGQVSEQWADYLKVCSCYACGNPRHNPWASEEERLTLQERRFLCE